jgi:hypothetical protein
MRLPAEDRDPLLGRHVAGLDRSALDVAAEEAAQPPRHLLPRVVRVLAQLLAGDLPEDAAAPERRGAAAELSVRPEDERRRAAVDLAVVDVVGELVEVDVALLAARRLRRVRQDPRQPLAWAIGLEGQLGLGVHDQPLLVRERQLLMDLPGDEDLLLGILEVVAHEDAGVLLPQVAAGQGLQREEEREADLAALGDPAEAGAVLQEGHLVGLEHQGLVVEAGEPAQEAPLGRQPFSELLLAALDDPQRHDAPPAPTAVCLAFPAVERLHVLATNDPTEVPT